MMQRVILFFLSVLLISIPTKLNAQIYTYTDKKGVLHFTNVPNDKRYRLYRAKDSRLKSEPYKHHQYDSIIKGAADKYGLNWALIKAIIRVESNFNPRAVSRKGARGLMQLMPDTARGLEVYNLFDPRENIEAGVRFLRHLKSQLNGDIVLTLAAYNAGLNNVRKYKRVPPFKETNRFVNKVLYYFRHYQ